MNASMEADLTRQSAAVLAGAIAAGDVSAEHSSDLIVPNPFASCAAMTYSVNAVHSSTVEPGARRTLAAASAASSSSVSGV